MQYPLALEVLASNSTNNLTLSIAYSRPLRHHAAAIARRASLLLEAPSSSIELSESRSHRPRLVRQQYDEKIWSDVEKVIRTHASQICDIPQEQISKNISFLRLGLDSISSIRLAQLLRAAGLQVRSSDILRQPSVGALAHFLTQRRDQANPVEVASNLRQKLPKDLGPTVPLFSDRDTLEYLYPATALQASMLTTTVSASVSYVVPHAFRLERSVDLQYLQTAWQAVAAARDVLRTTFHFSEEYTWVAAVHKEARLPWHTSVANDDRISQLVTSTSLSPESSQEDQLARSPFAIHIITGDSFSVLLLKIHHACVHPLADAKLI